MIEKLKAIKLNEIDKKLEELNKTIPVEPEKKGINKLIPTRKFDIAMAEYYKKLNEYNEIKSELEDKKMQYRKAQSLHYLDLTFEEGLKILKENGIPTVLTKDDLSCPSEETKPDVDSFEGLILVHKTGHVPNDGKIHTIKEVNRTVTVPLTIGNKEIEISLPSERNTVHFSVNGEVGSHLYGNWDDKKYAILIPFTDVPKRNIKSAACNDTFLEGGVALTPNSWILVPKGEREKVQENNPSVNVIEYDGPNVSGFADQLIKYLGYKCKKVNNNGWTLESKKDMEKYNKLMTYNDLPTAQHTNTEYFSEENFNKYAHQLDQIIKFLLENNELLSENDFNKKAKETIEITLDNMYKGFTLEIFISKICDKLKGTYYELPKEKLLEDSTRLDRYGITSYIAHIIIKKIKEQSNNRVNEEKTSKTK